MINGVAVETQKDMYYIKNSKKYRIFSENSLLSWRFNLIPGNESEIKNLKYGGVLGFRPGSLIKNTADGTLYVIDGNHKRQIKDMQKFKQHGLEGIPIYSASQAECDLHPTGEDL